MFGVFTPDLAKKILELLSEDKQLEASEIFIENIAAFDPNRFKMQLLKEGIDQEKAIFVIKLLKVADYLPCLMRF